MYIGVMLSAFAKKFYGKSFGKLSSVEMEDTVSRGIKWLLEHKLNCGEFLIDNVNVMEMLSKILVKYDKIIFIIHEWYCEKLAIKSSEQRIIYLDSAKRIIELASDVNVRSITIHPSYFYPPSDEYLMREKALNSLKRDEAWKISIRFLKELSKYALKNEIYLGIENMELYSYENGVKKLFPAFGRTIYELSEILSLVGYDSLKVTFDVGHANIGGNPVSFLEKMFPQIVHIHLHDNNGLRDLHAPLGSGTIDFKTIFKIIRENNYSGTMIVERSIDDNILNDINFMKKMLGLSGDNI
ncbi:MAG: hypothetical protein DRJ45_01710 [Thermoprotei archaeon]|nr:MAG: hypothetical protein DRJ45_01710 [Thermoprotei archaeon]